MDVPQFDWEEHIRDVTYSGLYGSNNGDYRWTSTMLRRQRERQDVLDITDTHYDRQQSDATCSTFEATLNEWFEGTGFYFLHGLHMMLRTYTMASTLPIRDGPDDHKLCLVTLTNWSEMTADVA
ncbi:hypothetical protein N7493_011541 [Penicillium malachiteum]|uniref:Uncharacterized protein n=1 Tax=Penicillium malachiteum TaxID=1324776 RepID=A0AAD6HAU8_9EURO|nr:hypothetical protein N7493_011541 [Penicillium malachiteum]